MVLLSKRSQYIFLSSFGVLAGALLALLLFIVLNSGREGRDFESLAHLRQSMLESSGPLEGRTVELRDILNPHPNDQLIYDLRPNLDVIFQGVRVRTNSCGMRNDEIAHQKPANTFRIAVLGDSFAFGWGVEQDRTFSARLQQFLNSLGSGNPKFEVLNFGVPGYSTFQEVALFSEKALDFEPDAVLVYFVENDFGLPFFVRDLNDQASLMPGTVLARLSWGGNEPRAEAEVQRQNQFNADRSLRTLAELTKQHGIKTFVAINPRSRWKEDSKRLPGTRRTPGIRLINMWDDFIRTIRYRGLTDSELSLANDPHPSAIKHGVYAEVLTPYFLDAANVSTSAD